MARLFGRYAAIIVTVVAFLLLVLGVLGLNFYTSFQTEVTAEAVNIAGRQRMLSQRTAKALSNLNFKFTAGTDFSKEIDELKRASTMFDRSLKAFTQGGITDSTKSGETRLEQVTALEGRQVVGQANTLWNPFFGDLSEMVVLLERSTENKTTIARMLDQNVAYANRHINEILKLMNDLTNFQEGVATASADRSRLIQALGIVASLICFSIILFLIFGQLRRADKKALLARQETQQIFETVDQGLFLIDQDLNMGTQHSKELERIFSTKSLAGKNFRSFIGEIVSSADLEKVQRYVKLLFDPHKKQRLLYDLNPLNRLPVQIEKNGELTNKYLRFSFSRVENDGNIDGILASVADISAEVRLANELAEETKRGEKQIEMIGVLLGADAQMLPEFIKGSDQTYQKINQIFRDPARSTKEFKEKADSVMTLIHSTKGEAAVLGLSLVAETCNDIETRIDELKNKTVIAGDDFLTLTIMLDRLISTNEQIKSVQSVISGHSTSSSNGDSNEAHSLGDTDNLIDLAKQVAHRQRKEVNLGIGGFESPGLTPKLRKDILSLASQLLRNAISHGIEPLAKRRETGKLSEGNIKLALLRESAGNLTLSCEDDGMGVDFDSLRKIAGEQGIIDKRDVDSISSKQLLNLMFRNRLSTRASADMDSGRGAGLGVIGTISNQLGAQVSLQTRLGVGSKFTIRIPSPKSDQPAFNHTGLEYA